MKPKLLLSQNYVDDKKRNRHVKKQNGNEKRNNQGEIVVNRPTTIMPSAMPAVGTLMLYRHRMAPKAIMGKKTAVNCAIGE